MLKQISTLIAILFAAIIVITLPAMAETDKPDAATEEQQVEEEKSQSQKKLAKRVDDRTLGVATFDSKAEEITVGRLIIGKAVTDRIIVWGNECQTIVDSEEDEAFR